jgi:integrase
VLVRAWGFKSPSGQASPNRELLDNRKNGVRPFSADVTRNVTGVTKGRIMARAPFSIIQRKTAAGRVFMARFYDAKGTVVKTKTFPDAKSPAAAARKAEALLNEGIIANAANPDALTYLQGFWTRESDYVRGRALRGVVLSDAYLTITRYVLNKHLAPKIKGKRLLDLDVDCIEALVLDLSAAGASPRTVNGVLNAIRVPMKYFCKRNRLADPLAAVERLADHPRERGVLSIAELQKIIALEESPRVKAGVLLAALCGLRLGEVVGIMPEDIDQATSMLIVQHNYIGAEVRGPKGSRPGSLRIRQVPAPRPVLDALGLCASLAPSGARFVLWNKMDASRPIGRKTLQDGFARILEAIGIKEAERKRRNLVFHGLRHTFVSLQRASGVPDFVTAKMSGHRSVAMLENYSRGAENVLNFAAAREAMEKTVLGKLAMDSVGAAI